MYPMSMTDCVHVIAHTDARVMSIAAMIVIAFFIFGSFCGVLFRQSVGPLQNGRALRASDALSVGRKRKGTAVAFGNPLVV